MTHPKRIIYGPFTECWRAHPARFCGVHNKGACMNRLGRRYAGFVQMNRACDINIEPAAALAWCPQILLQETVFSAHEGHRYLFEIDSLNPSAGLEFLEPVENLKFSRAALQTYAMKTSSNSVLGSRSSSPTDAIA
jgi:hypothetical protein